MFPLPRTAGRCALAWTITFSLVTAAVAGEETYEIDGSHSAAVFRIKHLNVSNCYGRFNKISGSFTLDDGDLSKGSMEVAIETESVDTADKKRDNHLRSPDFFNARQFPKISFKSRTIKRAGTDKYEVTGDLTLHGVTKSVNVVLDHTGAGSDPWGGYRAGFETTFKIKRSDYEMGGMQKALSDEVMLIVSIEGKRN